MPSEAALLPFQRGLNLLTAAKQQDIAKVMDVGCNAMHLTLTHPEGPQATDLKAQTPTNFTL